MFHKKNLLDSQLKVTRQCVALKLLLQSYYLLEFHNFSNYSVAAHLGDLQKSLKRDQRRPSLKIKRD